MLTTETLRCRIPSGWKAEPFHSYKNVVVFTRPGSGGYVTVDFNERIFNLGACPPLRMAPGRELRYAGAGWRDRLVEHACSWLDGVMGDGQ